MSANASKIISWQDKDGVRVIRFVQKELGINIDAKALIQEFEQAIEGLDKPKVLLNMDEVAYVASKGLGVLIQMHKQVWRRGGQVKVSNLTDYVHESFRTVKLHQLCEIYPSEEAAIRSFEG